MRDGGADEVREGQGTSGENESSRLNGGGRGGAVAPPAAIPGPVVQWERFLPVRSLKVLLVENDDCTRHVVSALLRNCSYEVTSVANGLQAWKVLVDLKNHVDIVLAEVVMPCLSGFGLLCKIMNHKTRKNIPVIMMSSNDSMGTVFKCLSKGAVDFLVKPIRKNELKNLWQHVWRRCHSSSGSGSESGIHAPKSGKSHSDDDSDNDTGSNNDDRNGSADNIRGGSDNGSGTQSSWTKRAVEADSPQTNFPSDQVAVQHDSTCAQDIHPKLDTSCNEWVHFSNTNVCMEHMESAENDFNERDLEIGLNKNIDLQHKLSANDKVSTYLTGPSVDKLAESDPKRDVHDAVLELHSNNMASRSSNEVADLIGGFPQASDAHVATGVINIAKSRDKINDKFKVPSLELSLKRLISSEDGGVTGNDERNVLRHSDLSAFSRYNISAASTHAAAGFGRICSPQVDNNLEAVKKESAHNMIYNPDAATVNQGSNGSSANNDKGSTSKNVLIKPGAGKVHLSALKRLQHETSTQQVMQEKLDNATAGATAMQHVGPQRQVQMQHHHHHYHHHHFHVHRMKQQFQPPPDNDGSSLMHMTVADPQSTSLNPFARPAEEKAANCSLNGSNSGSNHGSNGQNGSSMAPNRGTVNSGNGNDNTENGADLGNKSSNAEETNRFSQREAALNKFRLKRKERNFQKKVRYHSRKRLAEQRPRIRGQFVRQTEYETTSREAGSKSSE